MAKFSKLKKLLRDSPFPSEVQKAIVQEATDLQRSEALTEEAASVAAVQKFHDIVDEDMKAVRMALRK